MKIKLNGEYTEAELLQLIEEAKKTDWEDEYFEKYVGENLEEHDKIISRNVVLFADMFRFAMLRNDGWKPDWDNSEQQKWGLNCLENNIAINGYYSHNELRYGISVKSEEIAKEMLEIFGERIEEIYGKQ